MLEKLNTLEGYTLALAVSSLLVLLGWYFQSEKLPPGPVGWPFLGKLIDIVVKARNGTFVEWIYDLHERYGSIITIRAGVQTFIFIKDGKLLAQLFRKEEFSLRPSDSLPVMKTLSHGTPRGLIFANGDTSKEMRQFALLTLRDFGVGKSSLDEIVKTEASILCQYLEDFSLKNEGIMSELKMKIQNVTASIIHRIAFGYRYDYDDPKWIVLVQQLYDFFAINLFGFPENYLPFLNKVPKLNGYLTGNLNVKFLEINQSLEDYIQSQIDDHKTTYCADEIRDFIDLYIKYENEHREHYTKENIFATILDLFRAGTDTTATTLSWAIMYLVKYPEIQQELQQEVEEVLGDRSFLKADKEKLIKTRAFINEILRYVSIAPVSVPHTILNSTVVNGFTLPANCFIQANIFAIHHDKDYWEKPFEFSINRWIDDKGELLKHDGYFLPFSTGKRACPGKQLAHIEVIIILIEVLKNFKFERAEGYAEMTDSQSTGLVRAPQNYCFKVVKRD